MAGLKFQASILSFHIFYINLIESYESRAKIYLFKFNNRNTRTGCEICSKSFVNFEHVIAGTVVVLNRSK